MVGDATLCAMLTEIAEKKQPEARKDMGDKTGRQLEMVI